MLQESTGDRARQRHCGWGRGQLRRVLLPFFADPRSTRCEVRHIVYGSQTHCNEFAKTDLTYVRYELAFDTEAIYTDLTTFSQRRL